MHGAPDRRRVGARGAGARRQRRRAAGRARRARGWTRTAREVFAALYRVTRRAAVQPGAPRRDRRRRPSASRRRRWRAGGARSTAARRRSSATARSLYADDDRGAARRRARRCRRRCSPARLAGWRSAAPRRTAVEPGAVRPLYVRRPDAEIARDEKLRVHGSTQGTLSSRGASSRSRRPTQIDDVLAIEEASFTNPWTREMYLAELENHGVSFCFLARGRRRPGGRVLFVLAGRSTSCTSTTWRCCRSSGGSGVGIGAARARAAARRAARRAPRDARGAAVERRRARCCTSASGSRWPASGAATTPSRSRTPWSCWRENLDSSTLKR